MVLTERTASELACKARLAAEVRALQEDPDVVALKVEQTRTVVDRMIWGGLLVALAFTASNVQAFAARAIGAEHYSLAWWTCWLVDPMIWLPLLAILLTESRIAPGQIKLASLTRIAKWVLLIATYVMNTASSWAALDWAAIVLHSIPPIVALICAEILTDCHDKLTTFVNWAADRASRLFKRASRDAVPELPNPVPSRAPAPELAAEAPVPFAVVAPSPPSVPVTTANKPSSGAGTKPASSGQKVTRPDEEIIPELEKLIADLGHKPGIGTVKDQLGIGSGRATKLLAAIPDPASRNGHRPRQEVKL